MGMHILMVSEYFPPHSMGGGELSAFALAKGLVKKKVQVSVLTSHFPGDSEETIDGVKIYRRLKTGSGSGNIADNVGRLGFASSISDELPKLVDKIKPNVVHAMNVTSMPGVAKVLRGLPAVAHINSPLAFCPKGTKIAYGKECTKKCTFSHFVPCFMTSKELGRLSNKWYLKYNPFVWIAVYSRWTKIRNSLTKYQKYLPISTYMEKWLHKYNISKENTQVVPNIIDLERFAKAKGKKNDVPKILYLGGYVHMKGLHIVLEALKDVNQPYELHCYGAGGEKGRFEELAWKNGVKAAFHGKATQKDLPSIIAGSDMLVFPSLVPEAFGRVALEAMAASKPVIASNIGGIPDIVVQKTGYLFEPGNADELRQAIQKLLDNPKKSAEMGREGQKRVQKEFAEEFIVEKVIDIYRTVLK